MATNTYREGVGGAAVPDTYLESALPTTNVGAQVWLKIGFQSGKGATISRVLMRFDVSDIPAGAVIEWSDLGFNVSTAAPFASWPSHVYRVVQNAWTESGATWKAYDGSNDWVSAGCSHDGSDYTSTGGVAFDLPTVTGVFTISGMGALVQDAVDHRAGNLMLLLRRDTEAGSDGVAVFSSGENGTTGSRPQLTVSYTAGIPTLGRRRRGMV